MHEPAPLANSTICDGCATNFDCDSGSHGRGSHWGSCHRLVMHVARRGCGVAWQRLTRQRHSSQLLFVIVATQLITHLAIRHVLAVAPFIRTHTQLHLRCVLGQLSIASASFRSVTWFVRFFPVKLM